jgi:DNA-binding NarL/FixJ family response regulator
VSPPRSPGDPGGDGIRVLIADDHAGLRAGLHALLTAEPGITPVGSLAIAAKLWHRIDVAESDVVVADPDSRLADGLRSCLDVKNRVGGPSVVISSAYADRFLGAPARIAQADADGREVRNRAVQIIECLQKSRGGRT